MILKSLNSKTKKECIIYYVIDRSHNFKKCKYKNKEYVYDLLKMLLSCIIIQKSVIDQLHNLEECKCKNKKDIKNDFYK